MANTVIEALRRFLPEFLGEDPPLNPAQHRALWALTHCRTPTMGGHLHACEPCGTRQFRYHSCNHRACPQCGKTATAQWVAQQLSRRVGAPYFLVTFTLPQPLRPLFFTPAAKEVYALLFDAAAHALRLSLAHRRSLCATTSGFTLLLHTWNQRLLFHPHLHAIVPGAGIDPHDRVVRVQRSSFLAPKAVVRRAFRQRFRQGLQRLNAGGRLPPVDPRIWHRDWGLQLQPFGDGHNAIKYLGAYVCRTAIGDSRIQSITPTHLTFTCKDRAHGNVEKTETLEGVEFVRRYLRHVLPRGLKAIRHYGFCHPRAKDQRQRIGFHTGVPLSIEESHADQSTSSKPVRLPTCPCCGQPMKRLLRLLPAWRQPRGPPSPRLASHAA